jgi:hypothetical protein
MSNDDYFAQRPAGDGGPTPPTGGQPDPNAVPGQPVPYAAPAAPAAPAVPLYGAPQYGTPEYGAPQPGAQQPSYAYPAYGAPAYGTPPPGQPSYGYPYATSKTNGLAIAALVVSLISMVSCPLIGLAGAIMGHIARRQVTERREEGAGMALAGIIVGWIGLAIGILIVVFYIVLFAGLSSSGY